MIDLRHSISVPRPHLTNSLASLLHLASVVAIAAVTSAITFTNLHTAYDDAYITYRYASNLAQGYGFVYNHGEQFLGTTAPLWGLLLGVLGIPNPDAIPLIGSVLSGCSLLGIGLALYVYGRLHAQPFCGFLAAIFFMVNPVIPPTFGSEMLFQTALILWAFVSYRSERTRLAAALLTLAILTRPDATVALGVVGLHYLVTRRRVPWRELLVVTLLLLPCLGLAWMVYGSPLPQTLTVKRAQGQSGLWPLFIEGAVEWLRGFTMQGSSRFYPGIPAGPAMIRYLVLVVAGVPALGWIARFWLLPLSWIALFALSYHLLGVPFYGWYIVPIVLGLMILAASGVAGALALALHVLRRVWSGQRLMVAATVLSSAVVVLLAPGVYAQLVYHRRLGALEPSGGQQLYINAGRWLQQHTPAEASVGYFEIGYVGYYAQRRMIDPVGLVNPGVAPHVATCDLTWAYRSYQPDYIVHNPLIFQAYIGKMLDEPWFREQYHQVATVDYLGAVLTIYQRAGAP